MTTDPIHIIVDSAPRDAIKPVYVAIVGVLASFGTYLLGSRSKRRERQAAWYHDLVVDEAVPELAALFDKTGPLQAAARAWLKTPTRNTVPRDFTMHLNSFSEKALNAQNLIAERLYVFNDKSAASFVKLFEQVVLDPLFEWMEDVQLGNARYDEELAQFFLLAQRRLLKNLFDCEFINF